MKTKRKENLTNDKVSPRSEELADLSVTDELAENAKGGPTLTLNFEKISYRQVEYDDQH